MRLLAKRNVNPSEGIKPSESPNVGQYGWTSFEAHQYNQLIEYVNLAKESVDTCIKAATYVTKVMEEDVNPSFDKMGHLARNMEAMYIEFGKDYVVFGNNYEDFTVKYNNFTNLISDFDTGYSDFSSKYPDFVTKYNDVVVKHGEVAANTKRVEDLYNELKDGQVYRGVWNPSSGSYPNPEGTNSSWDVVLDEGKVTDTFDGKTWQNGHKLIWVVTDNAFTQISTAAGVVSINGKVGAVTLTAQDVNALPLTGGTLTGDLSVNTKIVAKSVGNPSEELILSAKDGVVKVGTNFVYHEGYKPTTAQIGAVPNTRLINNKQLNADITLTATDVKARPETWTPTVSEIRALPDNGAAILNGELTVRSSGEGGQINLEHIDGRKGFIDINANVNAIRLVNAMTSNTHTADLLSDGSFVVPKLRTRDNAEVNGQLEAKGNGWSVKATTLDGNGSQIVLGATGKLDFSMWNPTSDNAMRFGWRKADGSFDTKYYVLDNTFNINGTLTTSADISCGGSVYSPNKGAFVGLYPASGSQGNVRFTMPDELNGNGWHTRIHHDLRDGWILLGAKQTTGGSVEAYEVRIHSSSQDRTWRYQWDGTTILPGAVTVNGVTTGKVSNPTESWAQSGFLTESGSGGFARVGFHIVGQYAGWFGLHPHNGYFYLKSGDSGNGTLVLGNLFSDGVHDHGYRVYSPANPPSLREIPATESLSRSGENLEDVILKMAQRIEELEEKLNLLIKE